MYVNPLPQFRKKSSRMVRRTKEEALETRSRILDAAERVFYDKGVAHASLEDIAAVAEVTRGAIYWHFKDKAELFDAMMQRVVLPAEEMIERADGGGDGQTLTLLRNATVDVLMRTATDTRIQRIFEIAYHKCEYVGDARGVRDRHIASQAECLKTIEHGFRACVASGELPPSVDAKVAAVGAMSLVSGIIANWVLDPSSFALKKHAQALVDIYFRGLASTPVAARKAQSRTKSRIQEPAHARVAPRR
jgi:TetR/AcrR family acrAB operon transcriptional repressor